MIIYHQNNRGAFARNRIFLWVGQSFLHPRISINGGAAPAPAVVNVTHQQLRMWRSSMWLFLLEPVRRIVEWANS